MHKLWNKIQVCFVSLLDDSGILFIYIVTCNNAFIKLKKNN